MRLVSLPVGDDLLEVHNNNWTGYETVYFNGREASNKFSILGGSHFFTAEDAAGETDEYRVDIHLYWTGYVVDIFKNGKCLLASPRTNLTLVEHGGCGRSPRGKGRHLKREETPTRLDDSLLV